MRVLAKCQGEASGPFEQLAKRQVMGDGDYGVGSLGDPGKVVGEAGGRFLSLGPFVNVRGSQAVKE